MRKLLTLLFAACLLFYLVLPAQAAYYTMDLATIAGMTKTWDAANTTSGVLGVTNIGTAIDFENYIQFGDTSTTGWAAVGVGYAWPSMPAGSQDLSGYDGIQLNFKNVNNSNWFVNLYLNTGWTESGETDHFYQDGWINISPGVSTIVTLNFDAEGVINRNHVTNIGFQIGATLEADWPPSDPGNPSNGDVFHIEVVPEPATMTLLCLGALLLGKKSKG